MWSYARRRGDTEARIVRAFRVVAVNVWPPGINVRSDLIAILELSSGEVRSPKLGDWVTLDDDGRSDYIAAEWFERDYELVDPPAPTAHPNDRVLTDSPLEIL